MSVVGFDIGNKHCVVAVARRRGIEVLQNEVGKRKTPSLVAWSSVQRYIGDDAVSQAGSNWKGTIFNTKRFLGRHFSDPDMVTEFTHVPYKIVDMNGKVGAEVSYDGKQCQLLPEQVTGALFTKLKKIAEQGLEGTRVVDCVVGCPSYWNDEQRLALLDAANIAGLNVLRLMNETTAVALNYGILRPMPKEETRQVCFVDIGDSATNVSLVNFTNGKLTVQATASDPYLGGRDFDTLLEKHFTKYVLDKYNLDIKSQPKAILKMKKECNRVKTILSANNQVPFTIEYLLNDTDVKGQIDRASFEEMAAPLLERFSLPIQKALAQAGISVDSLHSVEVVGGACRIPCVQTALQNFFGKDLSKTCDGDESVARGCALQCAMLSPNFRVREFEIHDLTPYGINLDWGLVGGPVESTTGLFTACNVIPSVKIISFKDRTEPFALTARYTDDCEGLAPGTKPEIGRYVISGIPAGAYDEGKTPKIKVRVKMNVHGVLTVRSAQLLEEVEVDEPVVPVEEPAKMETDPPADAADAPADPPADAADSADAPAGDDAKAEEPAADPAMDTAPDKEEVPVEKKKKKTKKTRVDLKVESFTLGFGEAELKSAYETEANMMHQDRIIFETNELRNSLESYCLDMRSKVEDELKQYIADEDRVKFVEDLTTNEEWLYDEGYDAQKSEYRRRLDVLEKVGSPVIQRRFEHENRDESIEKLKKVIVQYQMWVPTEEEKYAHIEAEDRQKVAAKAQEIDTYLAECLGKQDKLTLADDPAFTCKQLADKVIQLEKYCNPIVDKPKPKPPKVEPKPEPEVAAEPAADAAADGAAPMADDAAPDAAANDAPVQDPNAAGMEMD